MQISILTTEVTNKGKYNQLEVTYKNLDSGKVESKKLMSFVKPENAYKALVDAKQGNQFSITTKKNAESGYWDWVDAVQAAPGSVQVEGSINKGTPAPKSNYETAEERAKKQIYIVRQSSIANAISVLTTGAKTPPAKEDVFKLAQEFTDWVFSNDAKQEFKPEKLVDMLDDIPELQ